VEIAERGFLTRDTSYEALANATLARMTAW
jgi:hypothetical protein